MAKVKLKTKVKETKYVVLKLTEQEAEDLRFVLGKCAGAARTIGTVHSALADVVEQSSRLDFKINHLGYPTFSEKTNA